MIISENYNNIFDAHAHYDDKRFKEDRESLFSYMMQKGVCGIVTSGIDIRTSRISLKYAGTYPFMYAAIGYHPENIDDRPLDYLYQLEQMLKDKKAVAVGEIGLDYYWSDEKEQQKQVFIEQLDLARQLEKPVVVHDRDAHGDTLKILKQYKPKGVLHCFSGSVEMLKEIMKLGMYISIGGVVTFKNAKKLAEAAKEVPIERLLLETDAPYLAPNPYRGKRCDSTMIAKTAEKIAELKEMDTQTLLDITKENAYEVYGLFDVPGS